MDDHNQQNLNNKQAKLGVRCVTIFLRGQVIPARYSTEEE